MKTTEEALAAAEQRQHVAAADYGTTANALEGATARVAELEARIARGGDVEYLEIAEARHRAEVLSRRRQHAHDEAQQARREAQAARARAIAADWDRTAPRLRAEIREAAQALADAHVRLLEAVRVHNSGAAAALLSLHHHGLGADKLTREPTREIPINQVVAFASTRRPQEAVGLSLCLPPDTLPIRDIRTAPIPPVPPPVPAAPLAPTVEEEWDDSAPHHRSVQRSPWKRK